MQKTKFVYWGHVRAESADFPGIWLDAKIRPRWYWFYRRVRLFLSIVWRESEGGRLSVPLAWQVSDCAIGLPPMRVNCGQIQEGANP